MSWLRGMRHRVQRLLFPGAYARELDEAMRFHVELDALQLGEAERARRRFGNRTYYTGETRRVEDPASVRRIWMEYHNTPLSPLVSASARTNPASGSRSVRASATYCDR